MKKNLSLFLTLVMLFSFSACGPPQQNTVPTNSATDRAYATAPPTPEQYETIIPEGSSFAVHCIDVEQGDAALVLCDDKLTAANSPPAILFTPI